MEGSSEGYTDGSVGTLNIDDHLAASCQHYFKEKIIFKTASQPDIYLLRLESNYRPLNPRMPEQNVDTPPAGSSRGTAVSEGNHLDSKDGIPAPKQVLYDPSFVKMKWPSPHGIGSGLANMGNTCFLNSVLQCLTYTPPLFNYLASDHHKKKCRGQGFCAMCEMQRHVQRVTTQSGGVVKPVTIVQNLRVIGKHFRQGRQEDAHEFLRYFVDGLQKGSLQGVAAQLDSHSKATTIIHHVFGGYHCSQVRCTKCQKTSETFDPLLDISLDIKNCNTLKQALNRFTKPDSLEGDNQYACPFCKLMTPALKKFTLHRLPSILTIQLKRFDYNSLLGGKINKPVSYTQQLDMRPYMTTKKGPPQWYQLYGVLVHSGFSCRSGHYYCYVKSPNKIWHCLNDAQVYQASSQQVLSQEAYLLFYTRDHDYHSPASPGTLQLQTSTASSTTVTTTNNTTPTSSRQNKVRPDPNFLDQPVKRSLHLDNTGVPFVRPKPTGIVPPSPQESNTTTTKTTQPQLNFPSHPPTLPLRKSDVDFTPKSTPPPVAIEPPKPMNLPVKKPSFIPRVITAPSSAKKKKVLPLNLSLSKADKRREASINEGQSDKHGDTVGDTASDINQEDEVGAGEGTSLQLPTAKGNEDSFIGPCLPGHFNTTSTATVPTTPPDGVTRSPRIARVHPQVQPGKPVARVQPVVTEGPKKVVTIVKGLAGDPLTNKPSQTVRPTWKPVGTPAAPPSPTTKSQTTATPDTTEDTPIKLATENVPLTTPSPQETKKRKKHKKKKKKKAHKTDEDREDSREWKYAEEKSRKRSTHYVTDRDSDEEDERPRKKRRTPEYDSRKDKKRSRHGSNRRRAPSRSSSDSSSDDNSDWGRYRYDRERDDKRSRGERRHERGDRHDSGKQRHSNGGSQSLHKSRYHSPTPDRNKRKRHWSTDSSDSHDGRYSKSVKQEATPKKRHSSDFHHHHHHHHHKHHDKIKRSKHLLKTSISESKSEGKMHSRHHEEEGGHHLEKDHVSSRSERRSENTSSMSARGGGGGEDDVPEVEWDSSLRGDGKREHGTRWDGSRSNTVVNVLTSHTPNQLGTKVKSWDGGVNSVDSTGLPGERKGKERDRDSWDQELDKGKVKRVKNRKETEFTPKKNPFQEFQNKKLQKTV